MCMCNEWSFKLLHIPVTSRLCVILCYFFHSGGISTAQLWLVLCWRIKSPPEWQMADQAQRGKSREGREGKEAVPHSQKCLGLEVREASAPAWGDIASPAETCCRRSVCSCWSFQHVGGSLSQNGLTSGQRGSVTPITVGWHRFTHNLKRTTFFFLHYPNFHTKLLLSFCCSVWRVK